jgi:rhodanese-related sulfurtransferase
MRKIFLVALIISLPLIVAAQSKKTIAQDLTIEEFKAKLETSPNAVLLDLRTPEELRKGTIANAEHIDYFQKDFENQIKNLDKDKVYLIYCAAGGRSEETKELMVKAGFKEVYNLSDGFDGWKKKKMPIQQ